MKYIKLEVLVITFTGDLTVMCLNVCKDFEYRL